MVQLIMEYLPLGSLKDYLPKRKLGILGCIMFAQQICQVSLGAFVVYRNHLQVPSILQYSWFCVQIADIHACT